MCKRWRVASKSQVIVGYSGPQSFSPHSCWNRSTLNAWSSPDTFHDSSPSKQSSWLCWFGEVKNWIAGVPLLRKTRRRFRGTSVIKRGVLDSQTLLVYFTHLGQQLLFFVTRFLCLMLISESLLVPSLHLFSDMATLPVVLFLPII